MAFGYQQLYANGLNNNTQLRRSTDMVYQRGGNYNIVLTGTTYEPSMELQIALYGDDVKVGLMNIVPYDISLTGGTYSYNFNLRPYDYMSNYVQSQHYTYYYQDDWSTTNNTINLNNPYPNIIKANFKYGYRYLSGGTYQNEWTGTTPTNDLNHFTFLPATQNATSYIPSGATNTGNYFNYVGGQFQMADDKFIRPNYDQEIGTTIGSGLTTTTTDLYRRISPMSTYLMDYPTVPEMSETARFLTDAPRIQYIQSDENYVLYYLNGQTGDRQVIEANYAIFKFYDQNNVQLVDEYGYAEVKLNYSGTTYASPTGYTDNLKPFALPCGPVDISNLFVSGQTWSDVAYYTVQLFYSYPTDNANNITTGPVGPVSERFYFYLYDNCLPENTRIAFLNARGGYDYYTFKSYRQDTKKITSQTFDNRYFSTDISGPDVALGRASKTFGTDVNTEIVVESEYLTIPQAQWLEQLFYSTQVYEVKQNFKSPIDSATKIYWDLRPIQVLSTQVDTITKKHQKLNKYRITFKSADTFFANRGF